MFSLDLIEYYLFILQDHRFACNTEVCVQSNAECFTFFNGFI